MEHVNHINWMKLTQSCKESFFPSIAKGWQIIIIITIKIKDKILKDENDDIDSHIFHLLPPNSFCNSRYLYTKGT